MKPELIYRLNAGEEAAFKEVFLEYYKILLVYLYNQSSYSHDDHDRIIVDVFVALWRSIKRGTPVESELHLKNILFSSVKKNLISLIISYTTSSRKKNCRYVEDVSIYEIREESDRDKNELKNLLPYIKAAIAKLPPQCKTIFKMWALEDMDYHAIGKALKISPQTARNQKTRAIQLIKQRLQI